MTRVYAESKDDHFMLRCNGHAGDIEACNYITGCVYAFAGYVKNAEQDGKATVYHFDTDKYTGTYIMDCSGGEFVKAALEAAVIGLLMLQQERPKAIVVEYKLL